ncbi:MAG TPA: hypothetical protein VK327_04315 [Candidatus Paceibacterota bacterium]|nr:hypothetical protein [Candidatus Paceibacterota bacterium]
MDELFAFGSRSYCLFFLLLIFGRGMDFLSTWVATPNLVLEGNPIAKKLGWFWGISLNVVICMGLAFSGLAAVVVTTTSVLVAARNFQSAWLMRSLGEEIYRDWHVRRIQETPITLYLTCLAGNTLLTAVVGGALMFFGERQFIAVGVGMGIIAYAVAVAFYTLLAVWKNRRAMKRRQERHDLAVLTDDGSGVTK